MQVLKIELDHKGIEELLCSDEVKDLVQKAADKVVENADAIANGRYQAQVKIVDKSKRYGAYVRPIDRHARNSNKKHNTLIKALHQ